MPGQDFPVLPSPGGAEFTNLDAEQLGKLIGLTHYAMSNDETRPHLAGALLEGDAKNVRMVTTDGHRLCKAEYKHGQKGLSFSMLVPGKGVAELRRLVDEVKGEGTKDEAKGIGVVSTGGNVFFRRGEVNLSVKLTEEQFPPYARVIPKASDRRVVVGRLALTEALRRISLVASDKSGAVRFHVAPGTIRITSENPDVGEGSEELDVDFAGEPVEIGFNARYLLDVLLSIGEDEVALELGGELDPGVVKPVGGTDFIGVIMPMRI
jgi:DNA polymerase-3 subunit beta